jgi:cysteine-rich repeat protein
MRRARVSTALAAAFALSILAPDARGAVITVINADGGGEGFNDPTPVAPVGGNTGTTRGAQRLIAFQYAADLWGAVLRSAIEIRVQATFDPLSCSGSSAVLGQAGPISVQRDFAGAPVAGTWYHVALANSLAGVDLDAGDDIGATFNSVYGAGCAFPRGWYYGLDANPNPATETDFVSVVLHELGHGLGFATLVDINDTACDGDPADGSKSLGFDDAFMLNLEDHSTTKLWPLMTNGERVTSSTDTNDLHWVGATVVAGSGGLSAGRHVSGHVEMYAPSPAECGSSVSHFSDAVTPNELMEPAYTGPNHDLALTTAAFVDLGWPLVVCGDGVIDAPETCDDNNAAPGDGCSAACQIEECWSCTGEPSVCSALGDGAGCDDGNACTQTDTCLAATCMGADPVVCTPADSCLEAGVCDPATGLCSTGAITCIDHFLCYKAKTTHGTPKFTPQLGVSLDDQFESLTVDVKKSKDICAPADKNGEGIADPAIHLTAYQFKAVSGSPKHVPQTSLTVTNQLGSIVLDTVKPVMLLVPTAKDLNIDPPPPNPLSHEVDHYKCYKAKVHSGTPKFVKVTVTVADQFTAIKNFEVKKPALLCTPVDKNGEGVKHALVHQLCYKVKPAAPKHVPQLGLHLADQFGLERLDTKKEDLLCVPSLKELP